MNNPVILRTSTGFVQSESERQNEIFRDIMDNNHDISKEPALVAGALAIDGAIDKIKSTNLMPTSGLSGLVRELFDKVEV